MSGEASDSDKEEQELMSPFKSPKRPKCDRPSEVLSPMSLGDLDEVDEFMSFKTPAEIRAEAMRGSKKKLRDIDDCLREKKAEEENRRRQQAKLERKRESDRKLEDYQDVPETVESEENEDDAEREEQERQLETQLDQRELKVDEEARPAEAEHLLGPVTPPPSSSSC